MEHYRSVFATTAVMVIGLLASSPLIRAQNAPAAQARAHAIEVDRAGDGAWTDPPRAGLQMASPVGIDASPLPKPASFTLLSPTMAGLLMAGAMHPRTDRAENAQAPRRHRALKVARRERQPALADVTRQEMGASRPRQAAQIDSIGDLVRACLDTSAGCQKSDRVRPRNAFDGADGSAEVSGATSDAS